MPLAEKFEAAKKGTDSELDRYMEDDMGRDDDRYSQFFGKEKRVEEKLEFNASKGEHFLDRHKPKDSDITNPLEDITNKEIDKLVEGAFKKKENN